MGIYVLIAFIAIIISTGIFLANRDNTGEILLSGESKKEYNDFVLSVKEREHQWENRPYSYTNKPVQPVTLVPFDPNTTDSATFVRLGLRPYIARNILRYRAKGGKFRSPDAFAKIYGITPEQFRTLQPYITISDKYQIKRDTFRTALLNKRDTLAYFKYPEGTIIDLNKADTTELKKIPGIGSGIARMIVAYRNRLGGFYKTEQLREVRNLPAGLDKWFVVTPSFAIRKINLNKSGIERISSHPYFNFYQAKVIIEYRKKKGFLTNLNQLSLHEEFTPKDMERISHYAEF